jgi:hypothetical protein
MQPAAAFTIASGAKAHELAQHAARTFLRQHPDIPFHIIDEDGFTYLARQPKYSHIGELVSLRCLAGWLLSLEYQRVIHLDADTTILGRVDALLPTDYAGTLLTRDISAYDMRAPDLPRINAGVLSACGTGFWIEWTRRIYSLLLPPAATNFADQLTLRELHAAGSLDTRLLDEPAGGAYLNLSIREAPGPWSFDGSTLKKGGVPCHLYHAAGEREGTHEAPPEVREAVAVARSQAGDAPAPLDIRTLWESRQAAFTKDVESLLRSLPLTTLAGRFPDAYREAGGFLRCDCPAGWDKVRRLPPDSPYTRRYLKETGAFVYIER